MELTYDTYILLGGICSEQMFPRLKADAEVDLASVSKFYNIVWHTDEAQTLCLVSLIDNSQNSLSAMQSGGAVSSIKVGSYSETRTGSGAGMSLDSSVYSILSRYANLYKKPIGVLI